ncbi:purine-nucleoside phosphorylase [Mycoplasmopsis felis]|uniref:Uridine phosphorylase n=1 Tax=Mycoplasmopsis felis TaxID=33923 RepID=A0A809S8I3_9BACT|nr:purine-nucleoside phosphorylase [Mycoplasmopsis felis]WQQ01773.1 purine-nucleoside phosphorylase [Mycoplasmopsis felis]WQQ02214.1 purine-nucleoside phosphorylase [Mycoplasmopsis felis]WQQ03705.1 purine-nucleoside phosphorylase [Mycoplasmopsis felis]WQQ05540.1 purine-nucleoside phosphorylase [Mycoplasmopsis felis]WQQ05890.1 purine-nucleoside phosphorylase [Mycoplasmopsis felis]
MKTPHISARKEDIAKTVIMPGDPLRAKYIAETFLDPGYIQVNEVRNMFMFTGTYKGKPVTIAGSGMGCPSIGIYSYELFKFYDVDRIIRIGSAGSYVKDLGLYEVVLASEAFADSDAFRRIALGKTGNISLPSSNLNKEIKEIAQKLGTKLHEGRVHSSDVFYSVVPLEQRIKDTQSICVEMESYALFTNAEATGKEAACLLTISDNLITKEETSSAERQTAFTKMMEIALNLAK